MSICLLYFAIPQFTGHSLVCLPHLGLRPVRLDNLRDRPFQFGIYAKSTSKGGARVLKEFFKAALFYAKNLMSWQIYRAGRGSIRRKLEYMQNQQEKG